MIFDLSQGWRKGGANLARGVPLGLNTKRLRRRPIKSYQYIPTTGDAMLKCTNLGSIAAMTTIAENMTGEMVDLCRRPALFEWSAQAVIDRSPGKGIYF